MNGTSLENLSIKASKKQIDKIKELVKEEKLSETLIKKPEFLKDIKNILRSELNIEVTDENIQDLLKDIENVVRKESLEVLGEDKLDEVVGGISFKGIRNGLIVGTSALLGGAIGRTSGGLAAGLILTVNESTEDRKKDPDPSPGVCKMGKASMLVGRLSGAAVGAAIGQKIVDYLDS